MADGSIKRALVDRKLARVCGVGDTYKGLEYVVGERIGLAPLSHARVYL